MGKPSRAGFFQPRWDFPGRSGMQEKEVGCEKSKWNARRGRGRGRGRGGARVWQGGSPWKWDGTLTVGLDHLGPARATKDHDVSALLDSGVGVIVILPAVRTCQAASAISRELTVYWANAYGIPITLPLPSRRILTNTVPKRLNSRVTAASRARSSLPSGRLQTISDLFFAEDEQEKGKRGKESQTYLATNTQALGG